VHGRGAALSGNAGARRRPRPRCQAGRRRRQSRAWRPRAWSRPGRVSLTHAGEAPRWSRHVRFIFRLCLVLRLTCTGAPASCLEAARSPGEEGQGWRVALAQTQTRRCKGQTYAKAQEKAAAAQPLATPRRLRVLILAGARAEKAAAPPQSRNFFIRL
jgi:hypothetical protein